jgi:putative oxidoreductase
VVFAEVVCALMLVLGLFTRFAALALAITMAVAFFKIHEMKLSGPGSGELALMYLMAYATLFFTGAGKLSIDGNIGGGEKA